MRLQATLYNPVGLNATIKTGSGRVYKSARAQDFIKRSFLELRRKGFTPQPKGIYWCKVDMSIYTSRMDIDAPLKTTLDLCMWALSQIQEPDLNTMKRSNLQEKLGISDSWNSILLVKKYWESKKELQRIEIIYEFIPVASKREANDLTTRFQN